MELAGADIFHSHLPGPASRPIAATLQRDRSHPMMDPTTPPRHDEFTTRETAEESGGSGGKPGCRCRCGARVDDHHPGNSSTVEPARAFPRPALDAHPRLGVLLI
jgi:hypothetical protein